MSAKRTSAVLNLPILLIPNLPGIKGVPGVDAVVFNEKGSPLANLDQEINDFVVIVPITRDQGTLIWNPIEKQWYQAPVNGSPLFISTSRRPKPTLHRAPLRSTGSALVLRYRLVN